MHGEVKLTYLLTSDDVTKKIKKLERQILSASSFADPVKDWQSESESLASLSFHKQHNF